MDPITFLAAAVIGGVVSLVTWILKKFPVLDALNKTGTQLLVFAFALVIAMFIFGWQFVPVKYAETILAILASAITWYEVIISRFPESKK